MTCRATGRQRGGLGVGEIFLVAAPAGLVAFLAVMLMREVPLGTRSGIDLAREASLPGPEATAPVPGAVAVRGEPERR